MAAAEKGEVEIGLQTTDGLAHRVSFDEEKEVAIEDKRKTLRFISFFGKTPEFDEAQTEQKTGENVIRFPFLLPADVVIRRLIQEI